MIRDILQKFTIGLQEQVIDVQQKQINNLKKTSKRNQLLTNIEEKIGSFVVAIDDFRAADAIIDAANDFGFTSPDRRVRVKADGTSLISFFFDDDYDYTIITNWQEGLLTNQKPVLSAERDFNKIIDRLATNAKRKRELSDSLKEYKKSYRALYLLKASTAQRVMNGFEDLGKALNKRAKEDRVDVYVEDCGLYSQVTIYENGKLKSSEVIAKDYDQRVGKIIIG